MELSFLIHDHDQLQKSLPFRDEKGQLQNTQKYSFSLVWAKSIIARISFLDQLQKNLPFRDEKEQLQNTPKYSFSLVWVKSVIARISFFMIKKDLQNKPKISIFPRVSEVSNRAN